jgi:hypothetical protein
MFRKYHILLTAIAFLFLAGGCKRITEIEIPPIIIDPSDPNSFSRYLELPNGSTRVVGSPPASTTTGTPPNVQAGTNATIISSNGSTVAVPFTFNVPAGAQVGGFYVQVVGSDIYYIVQPDPNNPGQFTLPMGIPSASLSGQFCVNVWVYDDLNRVSTPVTQCVDILKLGTGALQVNLAWDTDNTDIDVHVVEPGGFEIYYSDKTSSATGGHLDRDDTDGFGPENIYWQNAPDGDYRVFVHYYGGNPRTRYFITINTPAGSRTYDGILEREDDQKDVVIIRKRGDQYSF